MNLILKVGPQTLRRDIDRWLQHHEGMPFRLYVPSSVASMFLLRQLYAVEEYRPQEVIHGITLHVDQFLVHKLDKHKQLLDHLDMFDNLQTFGKTESPECLIWIQQQ